ncbi:Uma2 family endonuclease [Polymorphospora rubra]|uniref:Putative restriction endonuclease domain-containing protein n=1 Tax=Polymorphospora rubra TaxID=338584 RepID=A0A810N2M2_9ACTN|nr:Uma2 family endonuclease [Polymorphospora rubra]BCJ66449.1 hypothetical protein Prubr_34700 [Polymorphospora rubra]
MSGAITQRAEPWTEEEYLALGDAFRRAELFDGGLHLPPAPTLRHQVIAHRLAEELDGGGRTAGLLTFHSVNVRLRAARLTIPDVVVTEVITLTEPAVNASAVRLVGEVVSPTNAAIDLVLKMHYYAAAKIGWYLIVEQDTKSLRLYRLHGVSYVEHAVARPGEVLRLTEPVVADIRPEDLHT